MLVVQLSLSRFCSTKNAQKQTKLLIKNGVDEAKKLSRICVFIIYDDDVVADQLCPVLRVRMYRKKCPEKRLIPSGMKKRSPYQSSPCPLPSGTLIKADKRKSANIADTNLSDQMKKLNPAQLRAFREVFENFDLEKSGTLTANELHQCINQLAGYQALTFDDVMAILEELDVKVSLSIK